MILCDLRRASPLITTEQRDRFRAGVRLALAVVPVAVIRALVRKWYAPPERGIGRK